MTVSQRFDKFLSNIAITYAQAENGLAKHTGVRRCLNRHYYGSTSGEANSMLIGSWGKKTRVRPPRDIDILFVLPTSVYHQYQGKSGNKQSQLLQEVKGVLSGCYKLTSMKGDGQIILIPFATQTVEVVPAFLLDNGRYWICDTNGGGRYKTVDPNDEIAVIDESSKESNGNTRILVRMLKKWQDKCSVELKSFWIELLAVEFLANWQHKAQSSVYYDWMIRDFMKHLIGRAGGYLTLRSTYESIYLGNSWKTKAETALGRATKACEHEAANRNYDAWWEWESIFGADVPLD
jgi:SMODS domain-containing protein